jgi:hypothetical protein
MTTTPDDLNARIDTLERHLDMLATTVQDTRDAIGVFAAHSSSIFSDFEGHLDTLTTTAQDVTLEDPSELRRAELLRKAYRNFVARYRDTLADLLSKTSRT